MPADNAEELKKLIEAVESGAADDGPKPVPLDAPDAPPPGPPFHAWTDVDAPRPQPLAAEAPPAPAPPRASTTRGSTAATTVVVGAGAPPGRAVSQATLNAMQRQRAGQGVETRAPAPRQQQQAEPPPRRAYSEQEQGLRSALGIDEIEAELAAAKAKNRELERLILKGRI